MFVDCDLATRNIDLAQTAAAITLATRAILTHFCRAGWYMDRRTAWRAKRLRVIEDAAFAELMRLQNRRRRRSGGVSLHPIKNMTAIEGALVLNNSTQRSLRRSCAFTAFRGWPTARGMSMGKVHLPDVNACAARRSLRA